MSYSYIAPAKDPEAILDYQMDWTDWLLAGETIIAEAVVPSDPALLISGVTLAGTGAVQWRTAGGVAGRDYLVTVSITTSTGQIDQRTVRIPVRER